MGKSLSDFIKENQKFLKIPDGGEFVGTFLGSRVIPNKWDIPKDGEPQKETVEYGFETEEGRKIIWTNGRMDVAQEMFNFKKGQKVRISRIGEGNKTRYSFRDANAPEPTEVSDEEVPF